MNDVKLIIFGVLASWALFFIFDYRHLKIENKRLSDEISAANDTITRLDNKVVFEDVITKDANAIIREVRNAPKSDDAPMAPVLRRTIDHIDRLRVTEGG